MAEEPIEASGRHACAATPANNALACSVCIRQANILAGSPARKPKVRNVAGACGSRSIGCKKSLAIEGNRLVSGPKICCQEVSSNTAAVVPTERYAAAPCPSSKGCAYCTAVSAQDRKSVV